VQWEKQVTKARKQTKKQFDRLAVDQPSAVSDMSETIYTDASEVDAIGTFGNNAAYGRGVGDSFTLGNNTQEFERIGDYDPISGPVSGGYNVGRFVEEDTYDDTYEDQRQNSNIYPIKTDESEFTGDVWGGQGSYRVQGLETASDVVGATYTSDHMRSDTADMTNDSSMDGDDGDDSTYKDRDYGPSHYNEFDIPQSNRPSPIMVLYDTILSHPALTCIAFPCVPCLAVYVKSTEHQRAAVPVRRRDKPKRNSRQPSRTRSEDNSTFADYNARQVCFDVILLYSYCSSYHDLNFVVFTTHPIETF